MKSIISFIKRKILRDPKERWNYQFASGRWEGLRDPIEQERLGKTADLVRELTTPLRKESNGQYSPNILEIGCGEGFFRQYLNDSDFKNFIGTDLSDVAIEHANQHFKDEKTLFLSSDMHLFIPMEQYDFIIFNECVYYTPDVVALVKRYFPYLKPNGYIIISIHHNFKAHEQLWNKILSITSKIKEKTVVNSYDTWDIRALKPF
jgi:2-polyprenyl-3-methyl-5-hydroxy-6-metoxy-1,4-benzoquinol methylase